MPAVWPSFAKAELFLVAVAALCLVCATAALIVQYAAPVTRPATTATIEQIEQDEPARVPLPAGPRKFQ